MCVSWDNKRAESAKLHIIFHICSVGCVKWTAVIWWRQNEQKKMWKISQQNIPQPTNELLHVLFIIRFISFVIRNQWMNIWNHDRDTATSNDFSRMEYAIVNTNLHIELAFRVPAYDSLYEGTSKCQWLLMRWWKNEHAREWKWKKEKKRSLRLNEVHGWRTFIATIARILCLCFVLYYRLLRSTHQNVFDLKSPLLLAATATLTIVRCSVYERCLPAGEENTVHEYGRYRSA